jgi:choline kinase
MNGNYGAIILAAGEGTRLKKYTEGLPKGMLVFQGKPLLQRQVNVLRAEGVRDISIVRGYAGDKISIPGVRYYENPEYSTTNMVVSLFCAREKLVGDIIVAYADILYEPRLLRMMMDDPHDIAVAVDITWKKYWQMRYGTVLNDLESLKLQDGRIMSLGRENPELHEVDARYIGLIKFSAAGTEAMRNIWDAYRGSHWERPWQVSGKPLRQAYMTDMLQALIDSGQAVHAVTTENGWLEFDTNEDYERATAWAVDGRLNEIMDMEVLKL